MARDGMNEFWITNFGIHKRVIQEDIQCYLGPGATVRSFTRNGEDGFLVTTPGELLTDEQIDDICRKSSERWEKEAAARIQTDSEKKLKRPAQQPVPMSRGSASHTPDPERSRHRRSDEKHRGEGSRRKSDERRKGDRESSRR